MSIEYRAWDKKYKEMLDVIKIEKDTYYCSDNSHRPKDRMILFKNTGKKDERGNALFETINSF